MFQQKCVTEFAKSCAASIEIRKMLVAISGIYPRTTRSKGSMILAVTSSSFQ
jgi:hypothetical protein